MSSPKSIEIQMYNVGLGDCFLLTLRSQKGNQEIKNRILIDFGSTGRNADSPEMKDIANQIVEDCGGKNSPLDAVVITHRHRDHMSGFGGKSGETIVTHLKPRYVLQPWTEDPEVDNPKPDLSADDNKEIAAYLYSLNEAQQLTDSVMKEVLVKEPRT